MNKMSRETFLENRRSGIGGSDIAAILGLSPWSTPYDVWLDKRGEGEELDPNTPALYWGTVLEDVVAREYAKRSGTKVQRINTMMRHQDAPYAIANIDRAVVNPSIAGNVRWSNGQLTTDRVLECKTANGFAAHLWGETGTDDIPEYYLLQGQWYMGITGARYCDLAVLIGGNDYRTYTIEHHDELFSDMLSVAEAFWKLVETGTAPDPLNTGDAKRRWPKHVKDRSVIASQDAQAAIRDLEKITAEIKDLKAKEDAAKTILMRDFEEAEVLTVGGETVATWRTQSSTRIDGKALKAAEPAIAALYSTTSETRILRIK